MNGKRLHMASKKEPCLVYKIAQSLGDFHKKQQRQSKSAMKSDSRWLLNSWLFSMHVLNYKKQLFIICFYKNAGALILPGKLLCEMEKAIVHSFGKVFVT